ncbi:MAG: hypothetical protein VYA30_03055 [Myxococcota bacterium]|nr:hypothetical protein [Myxococcota bacterium]
MRILLVLSIFAVWACDSSPQTTESGNTAVERPEPSPETSQTPEPRPQPMPSMSSDGNGDQRNTPQVTMTDGHWGPSTGVDLKEPDVVVEPGRSRRRMNLDQLEAAFLRVSGSLNWTERRNGNDVSLFQTLSATLGKPDFIQVTNEALEPTALFQKFLDDAARQVCQKMIARDSARGEENPILLFDRQSDMTINGHLSNLVRRFHNRLLDDSSNDLAQWRWFVESLRHVAETEEQTWHAVCVALFTHPDFYSY